MTCVNSLFNLFYFTNYRSGPGSGHICVYKTGQIWLRSGLEIVSLVQPYFVYT